METLQGLEQAMGMLLGLERGCSRWDLEMETLQGPHQAMGTLLGRDRGWCCWRSRRLSKPFGERNQACWYSTAGAGARDESLCKFQVY
jgi:hypothetical protein